MRHLITSVMVLAMGTTIWAADLPAESYEVSGSVMFNLANDDQAETPMFSGTLGYYVMDNLEIGALVSFQKHDYESYWRVSDVWGLSVFSEYNFNSGSAIVPFIGGSIGFLDGNDLDNDTAFSGAVYGGLKLFITETTAISAIARLGFADEEIYDFDRDNETSGEGSQAGIDLGLGVTILL